ncbi:MAG: NAD-glutamate dehydrogenase, partial [Alphaproteobacteria bacterium]
MDVSQRDPFAIKDRIIADVLDYARAHAPAGQRDDLLLFIETFYAHAAPDDIEDQSVEDLYWLAHCMWRLGEVRTPGEPLVRVFNPKRKEDGWTTPHTAIAIINDDMPFLVDSVTGGLAVIDHHQIFVVHHPILLVERDEKGRRRAVAGACGFDHEEDRGHLRESCMYIEIDAQSDARSRRAIEKRIRSILADVRVAVTDWRAMLAKIDETVAALTVNPPPISEDMQQETIRFLRWMGDENYTFLGFREYRFEGDPKDSAFSAVRGSGLGILRDPRRYVLRGAKGLTVLSEEIRDFLRKPDQPVIITKANVKATVHRPVHMDYIGIKIYDEDGAVIGERRFTGLFTSKSYAESVFDVPLLRRKVANVQRRARFDPRSHAGKALTHILETFPRDEIFQIDEDRLLRTALGILHLMERPRPRAFIRRDRFERFVSALVYVPRDVYHAGLREEIAEILCEAFGGELSVYYAQVSDAVLARWHFIIRTRPGEVRDADEHEIDRRITEVVKGWAERLKELLMERFGEEEGLKLFRRFGTVFSRAYQDDFEPRQAILDIAKLREVEGEGPEIGFDLYRRIYDPESCVHLKLYHASKIVPLSEVLPVLENLGLQVISENAYELAREKGGCIHDFFLKKAGDGIIDLDEAKERLEDLLTAIWADKAENDPFNGLVMAAGMDWREVTVFRAYGRYLRQIGLPFGQGYIASSLIAHPGITRDLLALFVAKFDPGVRARDRQAAIEPIIERLYEALDKVRSLDQDRILRNYINLVRATLRTNFYLPFDRPRHGQEIGLAFKLRSREIEEAPLPRPWAEIFVYSPRVEGVHLRMGPVARGGLRWSDRRQDFRTEVLGLVKAQQVKNAVIVPVGAKGGFVPKKLPPASRREEFMAEGVASYKLFVASLLSLTDNLKDGRPVTPRRIVRHDDEDPYLVVAADKGTARFSDIANGIAQAFGFWLGDAFASGGSHGYDHKAMGITAKGAWVSVERHFREMGINVASDPVEVIGVGDMSGDVFGNGMLCSRAIRLKAAFDHRHIFLDPDPDPSVSYEERKRLFALPRSSWADYDVKKISKGGGIFARSEKRIPLSREVRAWLGVEEKELSPPALIRAILKAQADLLWFGGIGTYVKASEESHVEVGDRTNDAVRVDARELRVKVVGEGANLGMTQRARIEFARAGGRLNTDFIDNSAGVDCSDKEVNIKILLADAVRHGRLDMAARNALLVEMTDEVARIVLSDNYLQTQAISLAEAQASKAREAHAGLIRVLEREGTLDREIEHLPSEDQISELALTQKGLTRPELAVLMSYAKLSLKAILMNGTLIDDPVLRPELEWSFPHPLRERFGDLLDQHRLRRELVCTVLVNEIVNRGGITFFYEVREETGLGIDDIAAAYVITRDVFSLSALWDEIDALDYRVPAAIQTLMHLELQEFLKHQTTWFLRNESRPFDIPRLKESYRDGVESLLQAPERVLAPLALEQFEAKREMYEGQGVPPALARHLAGLLALRFACDIEKVANLLGRPVAEVGLTYSEVGHRLGFDWLRQTAELVAIEDHWDRLAASAVLDDLADQQRELTREILSCHPDRFGAEVVEAWLAEND